MDRIDEVEWVLLLCMCTSAMLAERGLPYEDPWAMAVSLLTDDTEPSMTDAEVAASFAEVMRRVKDG